MLHVTSLLIHIWMIKGVAVQLEKSICGPLVGWNVIEEEQRKERKVQRDGVGYMDVSRNMDCQLASRSVLKDFTGDALLFSSGNLFQKGTAGMVFSCW